MEDMELAYQQPLNQDHQWFQKSYYLDHHQTKLIEAFQYRYVTKTNHPDKYMMVVKILVGHQNLKQHLSFQKVERSTEISGAIIVPKLPSTIAPTTSINSPSL